MWDKRLVHLFVCFFFFAQLGLCVFTYTYTRLKYYAVSQSMYIAFLSKISSMLNKQYI